MTGATDGLLPAAWRRGSAAGRGVLAVALLAALGALDPAWGAWQTFGLADGLAALHVSAIIEDRSENLWFGTPSGASRFDGVAFRTFTEADGLGNANIRAIASDHAGRLWFATAAGVSRYDGSAWKAYSTSDGLASDDVRGVIEDHAGRMWFATYGGGVSRFDGTNWVRYPQAAGQLADNYVLCAFEDHAGNLWFGTQYSGVSRLGSDASWTTFTAPTQVATNAVTCIYETHDGVMWFGTSLGVSRFDGTSWRTFATAGSLSLNNANSLYEDGAGALWVGVGAGLARFDGLTWRTYSNADGLASGSVLAVALDRSGNVWTGTDRGGVSRYDGESWARFTAANLGSWGAQALLEDRTGAVWAGTPGAGVAHYDRKVWTSYRAAAGGLANDNVAALCEDSTGAVWFGTASGASRYDGVGWRTYTTADSLAGTDVRAIARDRAGWIWIGTTTGLSRFDGASWRSFTRAAGLAADEVRSLCVDRAGRLWCGTTAGVSRYDGSAWSTYSTADGLADTTISAILQDHAGVMWFGTPSGLSCFDGATWRTYRQADGLAADPVLSIAEDWDSVLWIGTAGGGVSRFDGKLWHTYTTADGLPDKTAVSAAIVEHSGNLWFGTVGGAALYAPARVPPQTVITSPAPALSASRLQTVRYVAAYRQVVGIEFQAALDGAPWPATWTTDDSWIGRDLADGVHTLQVRARDALHHADPTPAACTFEVDATPPVPVLTAPFVDQPCRDTLVVRGTAADARFRSLRVDLRPAGAASWDPPADTLLVQSATPVNNGVLARLATQALPDGDYDLRLSVADTLGLTGVAMVSFVIDNQPPWANETAPALVSGEAGGDVWTTHREAHIFIPPHALVLDARVHLDPLDASAVPDTMPDGALRMAPGFAFGLEGVPLTKAALLDLALPAGAAPPGTRLALYAQGTDSLWHRLGGTPDAANARIASPVTGAGRYAIAAGPAGALAGGSSLALSLTPRAFSLHGTSASPGVGIGFVLARAGTVRITVHNRAGRLVREVVSGASLGAGANLVRWDGRDEESREVEEGLYLVTVEALGAKQVRALAVVR